MALKTQPNSASVTAFLNNIDDEQRRKDCLTVVDIMKRATKTEPRMWGCSTCHRGAVDPMAAR